MLAPLRSVNERRFSRLHVFLKSFKDWLSPVQQCQGNVTEDARKCSYRIKHVKDLK